MTDASLAGFTIGITADRRWEEQAELLKRRDAAILHGPTIKTLPVGPDDDLRSVTESLILDPPSVVIANTGIGMRAWFAAADSWGIGEALTGSLAGARIFARGPKASAAVHQAGLDVIARAQSERMEEVIALAVESGVDGQIVALQRHGDVSSEAIDELTAAGATVIEVPVYRWILPVDLDPARSLIDATISGRVQAVTFTSAPAVRNMAMIADDAGLLDALVTAFERDVIPVCVGPVCSGAAHEIGITQTVTPDRFRLGPMIRTLTEALVERGTRTTLGGVPIALQGRVAVIGDEHVTLSDREAALLRVLLDEAPKVVTRTDLLSAVWEPGTDPHVLDVTIGRLRRRLGSVSNAAVAAGIVSVPRRGYAAAS
jgi:uroporphyrinogen-III synthase